MPPTDKTVYNVDWILSGASNVHIATSRDWFDTYTPLTSTVHSFAGPELSHPVIGIGSVSIPVKPYTNKPGSNTITLSDVLHIPDAFSNVVCMSLIKEDFDIEGCSVPWDGGWIRNKQTAGGRKLGIIEVPLLQKLRLKGQPAGHTSLGDKSTFGGLLWPPDEVEKWEKESGNRARIGVAEAPPPSNEISPSPSPPSSKKSSGTMMISPPGSQQKIRLSLKERLWVEGAYGGLDSFCKQYAITDPKEAKRLVKDVMWQCDDDDEVTRERIRARAILKQYEGTRIPAGGSKIEMALKMSRMLLSMAPENHNVIDQRYDSD